MFKVERAVRSQLKLKILLAGPSGSGKTMSALKLGHGMVGSWEKIIVIDTENRSSALYSHLGPFLQISFEPPYSYERYIEALKFAESQPNVELIIIDGISQLWDMEGGALERHGKLGGRFTDWSKIRPIENKWNEQIKKCSKHLLITGRTKTDYSIDKDDKGKSKIEKVGTKLVQRDGFEYEMTIAFRIDVQHFACIDKDRTDIFNNGLPFIISEKTGLKIKQWNESGKPMTEQQNISPKENEKLPEEINKAFDSQSVNLPDTGEFIDNHLNKNEKTLSKYRSIFMKRISDKARGHKEAEERIFQGLGFNVKNNNYTIEEYDNFINKLNFMEKIMSEVGNNRDKYNQVTSKHHIDLKQPYTKSEIEALEKKIMDDMTDISIQQSMSLQG